MKFTKLLIMGVLALCGANSAWAVDGNVWTKPAFPSVPEVTTFTTYEAGKEVYLYNVATHLFYTGGTNWGTRASLVSATNGDGSGATAGEAVKGAPVTFTVTDASTQRGTDKGVEGCVELKSYVWKFSENRSTFAGAWDDIWVDNNTRDDRFWVVKTVGDSYRIHNVNTLPDKCIGWNATDLKLYLIDADAEGAAWKMVEADTYTAWEASLPEDLLTQLKSWLTAVDTYNAAQTLKETLDKAEAMEAKVADQIAVYNNTASTKDQLTAANSAALTAIAEREKEIAEQNMNNASAENPIDLTSFIVNASYDVSKSDGWSGSVPSGYSYTAPEQYEGTTSTNPFDQYQDIKGLNNGVYAVGVQGYARECSTADAYKQWLNGTKNVGTVYATSDDDTQSVPLANIFEGSTSEKFGVGTEYGPDGTDKAGQSNYVPNNMQAAATYFSNGRYKNVVFTDVTGGTLRIGLKQPSDAGMRWTMWDNWTLIYYGSGADAYQLWNDKALAGFATTLGEGVFYTQSYVDALNAAITGKTATNKAEVVANITAAEAAQTALAENISLWNQWNTQVEDAAKTYRNNKDANIDIDIKMDLLDYIESEEGFTCKADEIKAAKNLDNEGLKAAMAELKALVDAFELAVKNQIKAGDDVTRFLVNPSFDVTGDAEKGWNGWHKTTNSMPTTGGTDDNKTAEAWSAKEFDLYQEVENAPVGVYEISVQGFYRYGRDDNAYNIFKAQEVEYVKPKSAPVYVYMNDKKTPFKNIYDEESPGQDFYVSMANTDAETGEPLKGATGIYQWKAIPYSVQNYPADAPTMFFPNGMASAAVAFSAGMYTQTATSLVAKQGDKLRLGVKGSTQQPDMTDCWVIWDNFKLTYKGKSAEDVKPVLAEAIEDAKNVLKDPETQEEKPIGKDAYETLMAAIASAEAALESNDGAKMFDELAKLVSVNVDASAEKFKSLKAAYLKFEDAVNTAEAADAASKPSDATIAAAWALHDEVMEGMENRTMTDADADAKIKEMEEMTKKLLVPATFDIASDAQPASATFYITNPKYADNADTGWTGGAAVANHEAEMFNKDFDYYQDIENVKPGTYRLSIQGFYRAGSSVNDFKLFTEAPDSANNAFLYAVTANGTSSAPLKRLASCAIQQTAGEAIPADWAAAKTDTIFNDNGEKVDTILTHTVVVNRMSTAEQVFAKEEAAENYSGTSVVVKVGDDGKLRIGVKKQARIETEWTIWTNWQLTYYGANSTLNVDGDPSGINETRGAAVAKAEYFTIGGAQVSKPGKGVAIVKQTMNDGSVKIQKVIIK